MFVGGELVVESVDSFLECYLGVQLISQWSSFVMGPWDLAHKITNKIIGTSDF
jgi:hypothetical protein